MTYKDLTKLRQKEQQKLLDIISESTICNKFETCLQFSGEEGNNSSYFNI
jgi:hypothetical protein